MAASRTTFRKLADRQWLLERMVIDRSFGKRKR